MSRPSASSLAVVAPATKARMAPPANITPEESVVWRDVVDSKPVDWFGADSAPLLAEYCRATVACDRLSAMVEAAFAGGDPAVLKDVVKLRDIESRRLTTIGTKLRLTQQSRYTPTAASTATKKAGNERPWQQQG